MIFHDYFRALDRIPQTSIEELDSDDPRMVLVIIDRKQREERLRRAWIAENE